MKFTPKEYPLIRFLAGSVVGTGALGCECGPYREHAWSIHGAHMKHTWSTHEAHMEHTWNTHGAYMKHIWSIHGAYMEHA